MGQTSDLGALGSKLQGTQINLLQKPHLGAEQWSPPVKVGPQSFLGLLGRDLATAPPSLGLRVCAAPPDPEPRQAGGEESSSP